MSSFQKGNVSLAITVIVVNTHANIQNLVFSVKGHAIADRHCAIIKMDVRLQVKQF